MKKLVTIISIILLTFELNAQEAEPVENNFMGTRLINGQSANLARNGELLLLIQHRFGNINGGFYEFFGIDQATMRIGFEYGFGNNLNLGFGRSSYLKTYDIFGKYRIIQQSSNFPITAVITTGGSFPIIKDYFPDPYNNFSDKVSGNIQVHIAKTINKFSFQVSPGFIRTGYLTEISKDISMFTTGLGSSFRISKDLTANVEYLLRFNSDVPGHNPLSLGIDIHTGGHIFQIVVSNSQHMYDQAIYTSAAGDWTEGSLFLGFNLIREFKLKYYE